MSIWDTGINRPFPSLWTSWPRRRAESPTVTVSVSRADLDSPTINSRGWVNLFCSIYFSAVAIEIRDHDSLGRMFGRRCISSTDVVDRVLDQTGECPVLFPQDPRVGI
jgi:hypothetical protein